MYLVNPLDTQLFTVVANWALRRSVGFTELIPNQGSAPLDPLQSILQVQSLDGTHGPEGGCVILAILESGPGDGTLEFRLIFVSLEGIMHSVLCHTWYVLLSVRKKKQILKIRSV
jgi:hypothetical protein